MSEQLHTSTSSTNSQTITDEDIEDVARVIAEAALDKKALDLVVLDVRGQASYADYIVVCSGRNDRHVQAIAKGIDDEISPYKDLLGKEGLGQGHWVLLDYGDVVVHIFYAPNRKVYDLERLWADVPRLDVEVPEELRADPSLYEGYDLD